MPLALHLIVLHMMRTKYNFLSNILLLPYRPLILSSMSASSDKLLVIMCPKYLYDCVTVSTVSPSDMFFLFCFFNYVLLYYLVIITYVLN